LSGGAALTSESGPSRTVEVDLTPYSLGKPALWARAWAIPLEIYGWFGFLLLLMVVSKGVGPVMALVGMLAALTVLLVAFAFVAMMVRRASSSTTGTKVACLRPKDASATPAGFDRPLGEILENLENLRKTAAPPAGSPTKASAHATAYYIAGVAILVAGAVLFAVIRLTGAIPVMLLTGSAILMFTRARRTRLRGAEATLADDPRPPILYLRAFRDDRVKLMERVRLWGLEPDQPIRFEEALGEMVSGLGPFLAVGEPSEGLPQLGASRAYPPEDQWQATVLDWIARARVIAMLSGAPGWTHWEVERIVEAGRQDRLLLFLPPGGAAQRTERWSHSVASLANSSHGAALKALPVENLRLVLLRPDGQVMAFRSRGATVQDYELAASLALYAMLKP
jgi:hypothetical protein